MLWKEKGLCLHPTPFMWNVIVSYSCHWLLFVYDLIPYHLKNHQSQDTLNDWQSEHVMVFFVFSPHSNKYFAILESGIIMRCCFPFCLLILIDDDNDVAIYIPGIGNVHGGELLGIEDAEPTGASSSRYLADIVSHHTSFLRAQSQQDQFNLMHWNIFQQPPSHGQRQYAGPIGGEGSLNHLNIHHMIALHGPNPPAAVQEMTFKLEAHRIGLPPIPPLPNSTLFVEGLPANCTKREASRILLLEIYVFTECPLCFFPLLGLRYLSPILRLQGPEDCA